MKNGPVTFFLRVSLGKSVLQHNESFSYLVLTTSSGIMDHEEAHRKHLGGKLLGYFF